MQYHPPVHCWESGEYLGHCGYTCLGLNGHDGDHEWVLNSEIINHVNGRVIGDDAAPP